jgi:dienelactone hydrolase
MKKSLFVLFFAAAAGLLAQNFACENPEKYWDIDLLKIKPEYREAPFSESKADGLQALLIKGFGLAKGDNSWKGNSPSPLSKRTRAEFFAYMGFPSTPVPKGGFPAVVLIHGGGGTAYVQFVRHWVSKGYAVIALDWYNQRPVLENPKAEQNSTKRITLDGGRRQDHVSNVANMIIAHSVLRSQTDVNPEKTAFVGLSWGSWYGAMVAAVDNRFKGGVEIYCGDVKDTKEFINGRFHHAVKIPLYWVVSTNDQNMTVASITKAFKKCPTTYNRSIVVNLPHAHVGFLFDSCQRMVSHFVNGTANLPKLSDIKFKDGIASAEILDKGKGIKKAVLCYTDSKEKYHKRKWQHLPAEIKGDIVSAKIPEGAHSYYLSVFDGEGRFKDLCGSTDVIVLPFK